MSDGTPTADDRRTSTRRGLHRDAVEAVGMRIVSGELAVGATLLNETDLGEDLAVSRTVVCEAVKVLAAKGLVAAVESDAANLFVVLTARTLKPDLCVVARADTEDNVRKLEVAGADRVISPYSLGGRLIAQTLLRPDVVDFLEAVMYDESLHLFLEDLVVGVGSSIAACTVGDAGIRETTGANIVGLKHGDDVLVSPDADHPLHPGDVLVALGTRQQLEELEKLVQSPDAV